MPRTRTISDADILQAAIELVSQHGVDKFTFAALAAQLRLAPSTLVQRFGTKQQLLAAATKHCLQGMSDLFQVAEEHHGSPTQAITAAFVAMSRAVTGVQEFANGQIFFYLALTEPDTYATLRGSMQQVREDVQKLLDQAVAKRELRPCDTVALALNLQTTYEGAITTWLAYQDGTLDEWVRDRLATVFEPYRRHIT